MRKLMTVRMERPFAIVVLLTALGFCRVPFVNGATLTGSFTPVPRYTNVDLTAEGRVDWVHWGVITDSSLDRKAGVTPQIPDFIPSRFNGPYQYGDNYNGYSWTDGTPTRSIAYTTTGVWMFGKSNGFELDIPAGTATNILKVYVGAFAARGKFDAALGGTTLKYSDDSINNATTNGPGGVYTLTYAADAPAQP